MTVVAYYRMNGNSNDSSGNGLNGTDSNMSYPSRILNIAADFNGTSSQSYNQNALFDFNGTAPFTYHIIIIIHTYGSVVIGENRMAMMIQEGTTSSTYDKGFILRSPASAYPKGISFYAWAGAMKHATIPIADAPINTLLYLTGTYDGTNLKIYKNGVFYAQTACSSTYNFTNPRFVFSHQDASLGGPFFDGLLDEVIIDNTAWTAPAIKDKYSFYKGFF